MELDRNYAFKFCSPTRSAIQTGRNPIHVNVQSKCSSSLNRRSHSPLTEALRAQT